jgi:hypothetical protein
VSIVHVVNGDATAASLAEAELPGDIVVWADALDQGPLLPTADDDARAARAAFWAARLPGRGTAGDHAARLAGWDRAFDDAVRTAEEVVLWYEHDLFDQLALVRLLARAGRMTPAPKAQLSLVSIDRHDEVPEFKGLGQLEAYQLAALWPRRTPIAREAIDEAAAAWLAVTAPDPRGVAYLVKRIRVMPFLGFALERHLEDLPDSATGLSRTEAQVLRAIERGVSAERALLGATPAGERYYLTDTAVAHVVATLAGLGAITRGADGALAPAPLAKEIQAGRIDRVAHAGVDDWRGGVRLEGKGPVWRFDVGSRRVVFA